MVFNGIFSFLINYCIELKTQILKVYPLIHMTVNILLCSTGEAVCSLSAF